MARFSPFIGNSGYAMNMLQIRRQAAETLSEVTTASRKVTATSEFAVCVLLAVTAVALLALGVAVIALTRITKVSR